MTRSSRTCTPVRTSVGLAWLCGAVVVLGGCSGSGETRDGLRISGPSGEAQCEPHRPRVECAIDVGERLPLEVHGSTAGREDGYAGAGCGLGGATVPDVAVRWSAPSAGTYRVSTEGSTFDTLLSVRSGSCMGREITCSDDLAEDVTQSAAELELRKCQTITLVVDGRGVEQTGPFQLTIHGTETVCDDGIDGDGDGATDCDDRDCFGPQCPGQDDWRSDWADLEWQALQEVNERRAEGASCDGEPYPPAPPLEMDRALRRAARLHSQDMTEQGYFAHDSLDGRKLGDRVDEVGFEGRGPLGENILQQSTDAEQAVAAWMSSPGHCRNIMNPSFHVTGIGFADGADGPRWTQDFAASH